MKRTATLITSVVVLLCLLATTAFAGQSQVTSKQVKEDAKAAGTYVMKELLNQTSPLYYSSETVAAVGGSGAECQELKDAYTAAFKGYLDSNGGKLPANIENSGYYAWAINAMESLDENPADWAGYDLFALFEESAAACGNLYNNATALTMVVNHRAQFENAAGLEKIFLDAIAATYQTTEDGQAGWDNWGISVDNNGNIIAALAPFYSTDETIKNQIDAALAWIATMKSDEGYASDLKYGTSANANSTGVMLRAFAAIGDSENALETYHLLQLFRSEDTQGAYTYFGEANLYATKDALVGLNNYALFLEKQEAEEEPSSQPEETTEQVTEATTKEETTVPVTEAASGSNNSGKTTPSTGDSGMLLWGPATAMGISLIGVFCLRGRKASEA